MLDTTPEMQAKQLEIFFTKSVRERVRMGVNMTDFAYKVVMNSIIAQNEELTEREIAAELFRRYYENDFSEEELSTIMQAILQA